MLLLMPKIGTAQPVGALELSVTANNDYAQVSLNKEKEIDILANDYGLNDGIESVSILTYPLNGEVVVNEDYSLTYTPGFNYEGEDEIEYEICNTDGSCDDATVDIDVIYVDYEPYAVNDSLITYWAEELSINCMDNDSNLLNYPIELYIDTDAKKGYAYTLNDSIIVYCPDVGDSGSDSIQYTVYDDDGDYSSAWVIISLLSTGSSDEVFVPNGFSPNNDGVNDYFYIPSFEYTSSVKAKIFTRWGVLVYQNDDYQNDWDGTANTGDFNGSKLTPGTYYFRFEVSDLNLDIKGFVYINY